MDNLLIREVIVRPISKRPHASPKVVSEESMSISDVVFHECSDKKFFLCIIHDLSDQLKDMIRTDLARVCHGPDKALSGRRAYSYKSTLKSFITRYADKTKLTKMGMIAELLCHITLYHYLTSLKPASPFFNMEEGSIKKGFDLIAIDKSDQGFWFTEVKSGELGKLDSNTKIRGLIDLAKNDLANRIPHGEATIWYSAINNVELSLAAGKPEKEILIDLIHEFFDASEDGINKTKDARVILVPVLFEDTISTLDFSVITKKGLKVQEEGIFDKCRVFAIQKSTVDKVEQFLYDEADIL